jgi:hypothetical protein
VLSATIQYSSVAITVVSGKSTTNGMGWTTRY